MVAKYRQLARQVGGSASSLTNLMAESSDSNNVPEGVTLVFGSWALMDNGSGCVTGHLIAPKEPKTIVDGQLTKSSPELGGKSSTQASPAFNSKSAGNALITTRLGESAESDATPNSGNFQFSETLNNTWLTSSQSNAQRSSTRNYSKE